MLLGPPLNRAILEEGRQERLCEDVVEVRCGPVPAAVAAQVRDAAM